MHELCVIQMGKLPTLWLLSFCRTQKLWKKWWEQKTNSWFC